MNGAVDGAAITRARAALLTRLDAAVGGPARRHVIAVLACVLALDSADKATVGASATQLQSALHIGKTEIGILLAAVSLVGAIGTLPAGVLADRVRRTRLLEWSVWLWGVAMLVSGAATSFEFLLLTRLALGAVTAVAGPTIASLIGDYFPARERGRIFGFVLTGELIGTGIGFVASGLLASLTWRAAFWVLALPALLVVWLLHRLPEPARGGGSRLPQDAQQIRSAEQIESGEVPAYEQADAEEETDPDEEETPEEPSVGLARQKMRELDIDPHEDLVLTRDPVDMPLWQAVRYVLSIRTNLVLILASALAYFFFTGLRGFAVEFVKQHYGVGQGEVTSLTFVVGIGAVVGVLVGGRLGDRLLRHDHPSGRVVVAGTAVLLSAVIFLPAIVTTSLFVALPLLILATGCLGATNPPLDAARLDIMHPRLWGRAEATRTVIRNTTEAIAPLVFGYTAEHVFSGQRGLEYTFLVMLIPLAAAAVLMLVIGRRTYPRDVATADASRRSLQE